jgi:hypothetical protein
MSINSFSSVQSFVNKKTKAASLPPTIQAITNAAAPGPFSPYYYLEPTATTRSSNNQIIACTCVITNQTAPYTFLNGTYYMTSSCLTTQLSNGGYLSYAFNGSSSADILQSPSTYNSSGAYTGSVSTVTSGVTVLGEWMQIQLPYTLYVTTYNVFSAVGYNGSTWAQMFPKSFYLCGSNNGTTWTTIDNRSNVTGSTTAGSNIFTAPAYTQGFRYFRLIGQQIGTGGNLTRMGVALGIQGDYKG